jgi:hypothetical protein
VIRRWVDSLARTWLLQALLALALGSAAASLEDRLADVAVSAFVQHVVHPESASDVGLYNLVYGPCELDFTIAGTKIVYGALRSPTLALGVLCVTAWLVVRRSTLAVCPFCAPRIPVVATRCPICGSRLEPAET